MNKVDRWLLPDGIEEVLPERARITEDLRRKLVDMFEVWGYDYVIPPMVEFTDSLLTGTGQDIDLLTFKLTDQLSGRTLGIRADITPQAARMDAHSLHSEGVNRLCYAGHVLHTRAKAPLSSRSPLKVGVELFGEAGIDAEVEVLSLMIETLKTIALDKQYIDIGHVGIYRALVEAANLDSAQERLLFDLLQSKAYTEVDTWLQNNIEDDTARAWFLALAKLSGDVSVLDRAREEFESAPDEVHVALDELSELASIVMQRYPEAQFYFDLSELRGYHYHTGVVFGAFTPGLGNAIASGGRYDHVGEAFGRSRPATGFDVDLSAVCRMLPTTEGKQQGIFVEASADPAQWQEVARLRGSGERVVLGFSGQLSALEHQCCDRVLVNDGGQFVVREN